MQDAKYVLRLLSKVELRGCKVRFVRRRPSNLSGGGLLPSTLARGLEVEMSLLYILTLFSGTGLTQVSK
jgi:hypothetical protein